MATVDFPVPAEPVIRVNPAGSLSARETSSSQVVNARCANIFARRTSRLPMGGSLSARACAINAGVGVFIGDKCPNANLTYAPWRTPDAAGWQRC